jgi:hypothetical protein
MWYPDSVPVSTFARSARRGQFRRWIVLRLSCFHRFYRPVQQWAGRLRLESMLRAAAETRELPRTPTCFARPAVPGRLEVIQRPSPFPAVHEVPTLGRGARRLVRPAAASRPPRVIGPEVACHDRPGGSVAAGAVYIASGMPVVRVRRAEGIALAVYRERRCLLCTSPGLRALWRNDVRFV